MGAQHVMLYMAPNGPCKNVNPANLSQACCLTRKTACGEFQSLQETLYLMDPWPPNKHSTYGPSDVFHIVAEGGVYTRQGDAPGQRDWAAFLQTRASVLMESVNGTAHFLYDDQFSTNNVALLIFSNGNVTLRNLVWTGSPDTQNYPLALGAYMAVTVDNLVAHNYGQFMSVFVGDGYDCQFGVDHCGYETAAVSIRGLSILNASFPTPLLISVNEKYSQTQSSVSIRDSFFNGNIQYQKRRHESYDGFVTLNPAWLVDIGNVTFSGTISRGIHLENQKSSLSQDSVLNIHDIDMSGGVAVQGFILLSAVADSQTTLNLVNITIEDTRVLENYCVLFLGLQDLTQVSLEGLRIRNVTGFTMCLEGRGSSQDPNNMISVANSSFIQSGPFWDNGSYHLPYLNWPILFRDSFLEDTSLLLQYHALQMVRTQLKNTNVTTTGGTIELQGCFFIDGSAINITDTGGVLRVRDSFMGPVFLNDSSAAFNVTSFLESPSLVLTSHSRVTLNNTALLSQSSVACSFDGKSNKSIVTFIGSNNTGWWNASAPCAAAGTNCAFEGNHPPLCSPPHSSSGGFPEWIYIVAGVVGGIVIIAAIVITIICCRRCRTRNKTTQYLPLQTQLPEVDQ